MLFIWLFSNDGEIKGNIQDCRLLKKMLLVSDFNYVQQKLEERKK